MEPLTLADFPLMNIGAVVYRRMYSSPIFMAPSDAVAADLVFRLNRDELGKRSIDLFGPVGQSTLVYGKIG